MITSKVRNAWLGEVESAGKAVVTEGRQEEVFLPLMIGCTWMWVLLRLGDAGEIHLLDGGMLVDSETSWILKSARDETLPGLVRLVEAGWSVTVQELMQPVIPTRHTACSAVDIGYVFWNLRVAWNPQLHARRMRDNPLGQANVCVSRESHRLVMVNKARAEDGKRPIQGMGLSPMQEAFMKALGK